VNPKKIYPISADKKFSQKIKMVYEDNNQLKEKNEYNDCFTKHNVPFEMNAQIEKKIKIFDRIK
jgi:hypothetical protein